MADSWAGQGFAGNVAQRTKREVLCLNGVSAAALSAEARPAPNNLQQPRLSHARPPPGLLPHTLCLVPARCKDVCTKDIYCSAVCSWKIIPWKNLSAQP